MPAFLIRYGALILLPMAALLTYFVYAPGLHGYYLFDDYINIVDNATLRLTNLDWSGLASAALSTAAGPSGRPLSMISFALDGYIHGIDPYYLKQTNVYIHIVNGFLVYQLARQLLSTLPGLHLPRQRWIALAIAAAWLLHPLNLTSVLYIVQRMTSLSASFTLLALLCYVHGRNTMLHTNPARGWTWIALGMVVVTPLAVLAKENGALSYLLALVVEVCFFRFATPARQHKQVLLVLFSLTVVLPALTVLAYTALHPAWIMDTYAMRGITPMQRLYTEARVLCLYLRMLFVPDIATLGMYHDDIAASNGLFDPGESALACAIVVAAFAFALWSLKRQPVAAFSILFFLAGHSLESSILPLELAHEHRNYLPIFGPLFALFYYLLVLPAEPATQAQRFWKKSDIRVRIAVAAVAIAMLGAVCLGRASVWGDAADMKLKEVQHHPDSVRANIEAAAFYSALPATNAIEAQEYYNEAYGYYAKASSASASDTLGLFGLIALNSRHSLPIEENWVSTLAGRLEHKPMIPNTINALEGLAKCVSNGACANGADAAEAVFAGALRNPTLQGSGRADVMFALGDLILAARHDPDRALVLERSAAALLPDNVDEQMNLAMGLINAGHKKEALQVIAQSRKIDKLGIRAGQLNYLAGQAQD